MTRLRDSFQTYFRLFFAGLLLAIFTFVALSWADRKESPEQGFIDVPGGRVWYEIVGSGNATPLLTLHGGPGMPSDYLRPLEKLSKERPVIFYDQLGCGKSDRPKDPSLWQISHFVEELEVVRKKLGLEEVHILGHSWGTILANEYMTSKPRGVRSLIMSGPAISVRRWLKDANEYRKALPPETQTILKKHEDAGTTDSNEYQDAVMVYYQKHLCRLKPWPPEMESTFKNMGSDVYLTMWGPSEFFATGNLKDYDGEEKLKKITVPVMFISGRYDEATPETTKHYQNMIHGSSLVILENSSHAAMLEQPDLYVEAIRDFLHKVEK